ncbi:hypothetical protein [Lachnospira pectinoschiza]|uniref:DUF6311 domain-containing protein n=1 Tax=Lachnospira pectinoschiza TaxID=28052 RepID=A0A1G9SS02_9FIRM|nr:hypothetical protein [Lachnospira pectinoschiza]SDM38181.1 hypothetical protein SAMN05216544_0067 [Lachnospira pectinoschiza]
MNKIKKNIGMWCRNSYKDIIAIILMAIIITAFLQYFYNIFQCNINIPFNYTGNDELSTLVEAKITQETGWNVHTDNLAAPYGFDNHNNIISGLHNFDTLTTKIFTQITGSVGAGINLTFLSAFYLIALISYIVFRNLKLKRWISALGALDFAMLPFIFFRNEEHLVLTCYYFVPLAILMCFWLYEDERFFLPNKQFFKYKRNYWGLIMSLLVANSGIVYWQFFACMFICVAVFIRVLNKRHFIDIIRGLISLLSIITFMIIGCIPEIIYIINNGGGLAGRLRGIQDSEVFSLKIIQLILPVRGHGISYLESIINSYNSDVPCVNENVSSYIGFVGIIGLIVLFCILVTRKSIIKNEKVHERLAFLSGLNIFAILFGTIGGFGACMFVFMTQTLRSFNRISVHIGFFTIMAVCLLLDYYNDKIKKLYAKIIFILVVGAMFMITIWEQNPKLTFDYESVEESWVSDDNFVAEIENVMDDGAIIYQLPYQPYPESGCQLGMYPQELFKGYMHSHKLRWTYGITKDTEDAEYIQHFALLETSEMVAELKEAGFSGIYICRKAYTETDLDKLETELTELLGEPIISEDNTLSFFKID